MQHSEFLTADSTEIIYAVTMQDILSALERRLREVSSKLTVDDIRLACDELKPSSTTTWTFGTTSKWASMPGPSPATSNRKETTMTTRMLFGAEPKFIKFKVTKPVFETLTVKDSISSYFSNTRYTDPQQVFDAFHWLQRDTKEWLLPLHLDVKNSRC